MSTPFDQHSVNQLLRAAKRKLQDTAPGERIAGTSNEAEVSALEHDALEILSLVRSLKNTFALVNKTPQDILSLISSYWEDGYGDEGLIRLTHVCRWWREIFTSRSSLWTRLDCINFDKLKTYIERSKSSPLEVYLTRADDAPYREEALTLVVPHIGRLRILSVFGNSKQVLPVLVEHFSQSVPLLDNLKIKFGPFIVTRIKPAGVVTSLPWRGLSNLTTFSLCHIPEDRILLTYLLDFFETSPRLRYIQLHDSIPNSRNAPTDRMVSLPHLKELNITAQPSHAILLDHLSIPVGASLRLEFTFNEGEFSIPSHLPKSPDNLHNLSQTTATSLRFGTEQRSVHLSGPSGELYIHGNRTDEGDQPHVGTDQFFQSFPNQLDVSRSRWLAITGCAYHQQRPIETWALYKILRSMGDLRTLTLSRCANLPFILALDPNENSSNTILCSKLENLTFYVKYVPQFRIKALLKMAEARAASGASLSTISIVIVGDEFVPAREVFRLRKYVSSVEYRLDDVLPAWDALPPT